jgi:endogenous inhibitor of DNA gyrase (YacG/DUF329 family)
MSREVLRTRVSIRFGAACVTDAGSAHVRVYQADRRCRHEGCTTVLSIYNPAAYCSLHERREVDQQVRHAARQVLQRACANTACATAFVTTNPARVYCSDRCRMSAFQQRRQAEKRRSQQREVAGAQARETAGAQPHQAAG